MIAAALLLTALQAAPAPAAPAPAAPVAAASTGRLNLDTPVETIVADAKGKAVLDADLPQLTSHPSHEMFKGMSLHQPQAYAADQLTDAVLAKVGTDLAAVK